MSCCRLSVPRLRSAAEVCRLSVPQIRSAAEVCRLSVPQIRSAAEVCRLSEAEVLLLHQGQNNRKNRPYTKSAFHLNLTVVIIYNCRCDR
jgi:hypothetical protein